MPLTTYTSGQILTASSLNSNLSFATNSGGLTIVKAETSFGSAAAVAFDSVFTADYTNYRIIMQVTATSGTPQLNVTLRAGGSAATTNYRWQALNVAATAATASSAAAQTSWSAGNLQTSAGFIVIDLINPQVATRTAATISSNAGETANSYLYWSTNSNATSYDGLGFTPASSTISGTYTVYAYGKVIS